MLDLDSQFIPPPEGELFMPLVPELLKEQFPTTETLPGGKEIEIRTLRPDDKDRLWAFFSAIPEHDKLYLKEDLSDPAIAEEWSKNINYDEMLPIVAIDKDKIIGYATLRQYKRTWQRHIGIVRVGVHPDYRKQGIARTLLNHICELGKYSGLEKLEAEFMAEQNNAIHLFEMFGFTKMAVLPQHVIDFTGKRHDFVIMIFNMRDAEVFAAD